jgi:hypothetical protein
VRRILVERQLVLAAVALLGVAAALAVTTRHEAHASRAALPPSHGDYTALVGAGSSRAGGSRACGVAVGPRTLGVVSPVLPCGLRLYVTYRGKHALASVVGRGGGPGREFDLTAALAHRLGIAGVKRVRWSYAGAA